MEAAFHALYAQAEEQLAEVDFTAYAEVLFVSKSVGTIIASAYAQKLEQAGTTVEIRHILYTPLEATYTFAPKHAVAFIGTADIQRFLFILKLKVYRKELCSWYERRYCLCIR